jgi:hypothetical protein
MMANSVFSTRFKTAAHARQWRKKNKDRFYLAISKHETLHFDCMKDFLEVLADFKNSGKSKVVSR